MDLRAQDRRGLGEIVAWASAFIGLTVYSIAILVRTGQVDPHITALLGALVTALVARGTQSASERSARDELASKRESDAKLLESAAVSAARRAEDSARRIESMLQELKDRH